MTLGGSDRHLSLVLRAGRLADLATSPALVYPYSALARCLDEQSLKQVSLLGEQDVRRWRGQSPLVMASQTRLGRCR
jgi:hypothetical protein